MPRIELENTALSEATQPGGPVEVLVQPLGKEFFLISAEQFRKMQAALSGDFDPRHAYPLVESVMAEDDANDPLLESYQ